MKKLLAWIAAGASLASAALVAALVLSPAPSVRSFQEVRAAWSPSDVRIFDRHGELLHETRVDASVRRLAWAELEDVAPALVRAVVESEDRRFERHGGVDWRAVAAAAWQQVEGGAPRGASTVTMQLAALVDPSLRRGDGPRGPYAKLRQMRAAIAIEKKWTKREILEAYVNLVGFRGEVEGVRAASEAFFGKAPHGLTPEESAALAASIRSPNAGAEALLRRSRELATRLRAESGARVEAAALRLAGSASAQGSRLASIPHAARLLVQGRAGFDVRSALDARTQALATSALGRHVLEIRDRSASDGAVLVADNATGEVLAYVGSTGALSSAREVDGVRAPRQAGSTLKPFLYAQAIDDELLTPATLLDDTPFEISVGGRLYRPDNYDHRFRGLVPVRVALASSLNVPAVRAITLLGEERFAAKLRELGLSGVREQGDWYGPSLALGSVDVTLWDLVGAYRALANGGVWNPLRLKRDADADPRPGNPAEAPASQRAGDAGTDGRIRVFDASSAWIVADMLADRASRTATFDRGGPLSTPYWSAVKTGTSKDMRDNWCVGWSSRFTVGVWIGNFSGEPMHDVSGTSGAAPVWREVMDALHADVPSVQPAMPDGVVRGLEDVFRSGTEPTAGEAGLARHAHIVYPATGSTIAIDPDIPPHRQRVAFEARHADETLDWMLDGERLGSAAAPFLWKPARGRHVLKLVQANGTHVDHVRFEVRGSDARQIARRP